jgi:hypothetical protein
VLAILADATRKWGFKQEDGWVVMTDERGGEVRELMSSFSTTLRPDLVAIHSAVKKIEIMELTVPMEQNVQSKHDFKTGKYASLCNDLKSKGFDVTFHAVEIGCRGMVPQSATGYLRHLKMPKKKIRELAFQLSKMAAQCSWTIFNNRHSSTWSLND